jgi:hypothetical protein
VGKVHLEFYYQRGKYCLMQHQIEFHVVAEINGALIKFPDGNHQKPIDVATRAV